MSGRFLKKGGYVFDRYIFRVSSLLLIVLAGVAVGMYGFKNNYYVSCPISAPGGSCVNPYYSVVGTCDAPSPELCAYRIIPAGVTIGERPAQGPEIISLLGVVVTLLAFILNHIWHNTGERFRWKY